MTERELSWLAGFYEGEGSIGFYKRTQRHGERSYTYGFLKVTIGQKDVTPLRWIYKRMGGYLYRTKNTGMGKGYIWFWGCGNKKAREFALMIRPYMRSRWKRNQIRRAVAKDLAEVNI